MSATRSRLWRDLSPDSPVVPSRFQDGGPIGRGLRGGQWARTSDRLQRVESWWTFALFTSVQLNRSVSLRANGRRTPSERQSLDSCRGVRPLSPREPRLAPRGLFSCSRTSHDQLER